MSKEFETLDWEQLTQGLLDAVKDGMRLLYSPHASPHTDGMTVGERNDLNDGITRLLQHVKTLKDLSGSIADEASWNQLLLKAKSIAKDVDRFNETLGGLVAALKKRGPLS
jgi:hypothetical protein